MNATTVTNAILNRPRRHLENISNKIITTLDVNNTTTSLCQHTIATDDKIKFNTPEVLEDVHYYYIHKMLYLQIKNYINIVFNSEKVYV